MRVFKAVRLRISSYVGFLQTAEREEDMLQLPLGQGVEDVTLILGGIQGFFEQHPPGFGILLHPRVMAGRDRVHAEGLCPFEQGTEFQMAVAVDAGVGGCRRAAYTRPNFSTTVSRNRPVKSNTS